MDFHTIARMASGASGAELANIINEASIFGRSAVGGLIVTDQSDLEESIEVVIAGYQKKNAVLSDQEKKVVVAYHETGHALVAALQSHSAPVAEDYHHSTNLRCPWLYHAGGGTGDQIPAEQRRNWRTRSLHLRGGRAAEAI